MHLMRTFCYTKCYKCILAYIFQRKMFSITFDFVKCSASHFPKENVQQSKMLQMHLMLCKNIFLHHILLVLNIFQRKMFSITFCKAKCSAKSKKKCYKAQQKTKAVRTFCWCVALQKCIFASNAFLHQMHLMRTFCFALQKCIFASHFPLENVRQNAFDAKMHFWRTFSKGKCDAKMHFCKANQNVRKRQNAVFFALQKTKAVRCVALPKCILASNAFLLHQNAFLHQMHL